jgi:hypothetical protein
MSKAKLAERESEAIRDVCRLMLEWSARLGPKSRLGRGLEEEAEKTLAAWQRCGR